MAFSTELHIRVYDDSSGDYVSISPDADALGLIFVSVTARETIVVASR
jgi:hypothetical protein